MIIALYITLSISTLGWLASGILALIGHCTIDSGQETWENKKCEHLYYSFSAPITAIFTIVSIILCWIVLIIK